MSIGKYSPNRPNTAWPRSDFIYNCYGDIPPEWDKTKGPLDEKIHISGFDSNGFDCYGYSSFDEDGNYVGLGEGVDRNGYTELDYLRKSNEDY